MKVIKDFMCPKCDAFEKLVDNTDSETTCPNCGDHSPVVYHSMRFKLDGTDPGFPSAYDKWEKDHIKASQVK